MENFTAGYIDYRYLREKGYPEKASLKIVGDKYRLSRMERNTLFRGVIPAAMCEARKRKITASAEMSGANLGLDWYNVLITVESYLRGMPVFISDDGIMRDSSATHGSYRRSALTDRAETAIMETLASLRPGRADAFLDSPIAFSAEMAAELRGRLASIGIPTSVALEHSADFPLKSYHGIVASSDSVILDTAERICDLPRCVLESRFHFIPPSLPDLPIPFPSAPGRSSANGSPGW